MQCKHVPFSFYLFISVPFSSGRGVEWRQHQRLFPSLGILLTSQLCFSSSSHCWCSKEQEETTNPSISKFPCGHPCMGSLLNSSHNKTVIKAQIQKGELLKNFNQILHNWLFIHCFDRLSCDYHFCFSSSTWTSHPNLRLSFPLCQSPLDWGANSAAKLPFFSADYFPLS